MHFGRKWFAMLSVMRSDNGNAVLVRSGRIATMRTAFTRVPPRNDRCSHSSAMLPCVFETTIHDDVHSTGPSFAAADNHNQPMNVIMRARRISLIYIVASVDTGCRPRFTLLDPFQKRYLTGTDTGERIWGHVRGLPRYISEPLAVPFGGHVLMLSKWASLNRLTVGWMGVDTSVVKKEYDRNPMRWIEEEAIPARTSPSQTRSAVPVRQTGLDRKMCYRKTKA